jgi:hypothetical protein
MGKQLSNIDMNNNAIVGASEIKTTGLLRYADNGTGRGDLGFTTWNDGSNPYGGAMEFYSSVHATNPGYVNFVYGNSVNTGRMQFVSHSAANAYEVEAWINQDGSAVFTGDVSVPDEAYGIGWDGSLEVPTKNAIYDKIQTLGGGGATNLSQSLTSTTVAVNSDTGTDITIASADATNAGVLTSADKVKLDGIATGATANVGDVTLNGTQTLTNKTLTSPVINTPTGIVKGDVGLGNVDNTSDATKNAATATLTNKTLNASSVLFADNTDATKKAQFQLSGFTTGTTRLYSLPNYSATLATQAGTETLTNKTIALGSNTVSGTLAQLNTAVTDDDVMGLANAQTITGVKTFNTGALIMTSTDGTGEPYSDANPPQTLVMSDTTTPANPAAARSVLYTTDGKTLRQRDNDGTDTFLLNSATGVIRVVHGSTASTARPVGAASVEWVGSVAPTNGTTADTWIDTA